MRPEESDVVVDATPDSSGRIAPLRMTRLQVGRASATYARGLFNVYRIEFESQRRVELRARLGWQRSIGASTGSRASERGCCPLEKPDAAWRHQISQRSHCKSLQQRPLAHRCTGRERRGFRMLRMSSVIITEAGDFFGGVAEKSEKTRAKALIEEPGAAARLGRPIQAHCPCRALFSGSVFLPAPAEREVIA